MARPKRPPPESRIRLHYINEWADHRGMSQADIAESLSVDPGTVSRWFDGALPSEGALPRIAAMFGVDLAELFQAPGDGWLRRFFAGRSQEEIDHIKKSLEITFPKKDGTNG